MKTRWRPRVSTLSLLLLMYSVAAGFSGCSSKKPEGAELEASDTEGAEGEEGASENSNAENGSNNEGGDVANEMNQMNQGQGEVNGKEVAGEVKNIEDKAMGEAQASPNTLSNVAASNAVPESVGGYIGGVGGESAGVGLPEMGSKMAYIVKKGDTLSKIAKKVFNNMKKWRTLAEWTGMNNPNRIFPGDVIYYQLNQDSLAFATKYENNPRGKIAAAEKETLRTLAQKVYGDVRMWKVLWRLNDSVTGPNEILNAKQIYYTDAEVQPILVKTMESPKLATGELVNPEVNTRL